MRMGGALDTPAKLGVTVTEILEAIKQQNTVNPAGRGRRARPAGPSSPTVRAQGRLQSAEEFENVIIRANPDGSMIRVRDVARVELGAQVYNMMGRLNGKPAAIVAIYQPPAPTRSTPCTPRARADGGGRQNFLNDLDYAASSTRRSRHRGHRRDRQDFRSRRSSS
ncbi:MAG: efflux RND transporter permease subunit [Burkholderiaceae bacterium]